MAGQPDPQPLARALAELIALRGYARVRGDQQLQSAWQDVAGQFACSTRVLGLERGVLQIGVTNAPLLGELVSFHRGTLLESLRQKHPDLKIRDLKFKLRSSR
jgi:hypothetical protein